MPLFSLIIPVYKVENYLSQCIESLISQTFLNFEIILIDDGSLDNSGKICDEYAEKDTRIRVIHKENSGVTSARLAGAEMAKGEYIVCIDGDDWIRSDYLELFAGAINDHKTDVVCCGFVEVCNDVKKERPLWMREGFYDKEKIEKEYFNLLISRDDGLDFPSSIWAKAIRRELFCSIIKTVDKSITVWEDEALVKPCLYFANGIYVLKQCAYFYRKGHASVTNEKKTFGLDFPKLIGEHYEKYFDLQKFDFQKQIYRAVVNKFFVVAASQFYRKASYVTIVKEIKKKIEEPYYENAIKCCCFSNNRVLEFKHFVVKHRLCFLMWVHNRMRCYKINATRKIKNSAEVEKI